MRIQNLVTYIEAQVSRQYYLVINLLNIGVTFLGKLGPSFHIEIRRIFRILKTADFEIHSFFKSAVFEICSGFRLPTWFCTKVILLKRLILMTWIYM